MYHITLIFKWDGISVDWILYIHCAVSNLYKPGPKKIDLTFMYFIACTDQH